jgi:GxxExxY protein
MNVIERGNIPLPTFLCQIFVMPIHCPLTIRPLSDAVFAEIDRVVMGCAFASQNTLGRLCDERVYENDLAARLRAEGFTDVHTRLPITVTYDSFSKTYRLDLVVNQMVYELKVVASLSPEHDAEAIHYAALLAMDRVKLINFRTARVVGKLLRSPFARVNRRQVRFGEARWQPLSDRCEGLKRQMCALFADWGAFLETQLYEEGLVHFHGGEGACSRRVPVVRNGIELGTHQAPCHADKVAFVITALSDSSDAYEQHLRRLLSFTSLRGMQWINLNHAEIEFVTLMNGKGMKAEE